MLLSGRGKQCSFRLKYPRVQEINCYDEFYSELLEHERIGSVLILLLVDDES